MRFSLRWWSLIAGALAGGMLAGCGASPEEARPAEEAVALDACALFTFQDAEAATGVEVVGTMSSTLADVQGRNPLHCAYSTGSPEAPGIVSLEIRPAKDPKQAARRHKASKDSLVTLSRGKVEDVPGVGDAAFWVGGDLRQLHVLRGRHHLIFTIQAGNNPREAAKQVAATVLARLGSQGQPT